jgi:hypothetical protein
MNNLLKLSAHFHLLSKTSSLRSDMANRVMYELANALYPNEAAHDEINLDFATHGSKKLIQFGFAICAKEMYHHPEFNNKADINTIYPFYNKDLNKLEKPELLSVLQEYQAALKSFSIKFNDNTWEEGYGGKPWYKISLALLEITSLYMEYLKNKDSKIGKLLMIKLNMFDALAHNNANVYSKMVREENYDDFLEDSFDKNDTYKLYQLMDAKELNNPYETLLITERNLSMELPFKDYLQSARATKEYAFAKQKNNRQELRKINAIRRFKLGFLKIISAYVDETNNLQTMMNISNDFNNLTDNLIGIRDTLEELYHISINFYIEELSELLPQSDLLPIIEPLNSMRPLYFTIKEQINKILRAQRSVPNKADRARISEMINSCFKDIPIMLNYKNNAMLSMAKIFNEDIKIPQLSVPHINL